MHQQLHAAMLGWLAPCQVPKTQPANPGGSDMPGQDLGPGQSCGLLIRPLACRHRAGTCMAAMVGTAMRRDLRGPFNVMWQLGPALTAPAVGADTRLSTFMVTAGDPASRRDVPAPAASMWQLKDAEQDALSPKAGTGSVVRLLAPAHQCGARCMTSAGDVQAGG